MPNERWPTLYQTYFRVQNFCQNFFRNCPNILVLKCKSTSARVSSSAVARALWNEKEKLSFRALNLLMFFIYFICYSTYFIYRKCISSWNFQRALPIFSVWTASKVQPTKSNIRCKISWDSGSGWQQVIVYIQYWKWEGPVKKSQFCFKLCTWKHVRVMSYCWAKKQQRPRLLYSSALPKMEKTWKKLNPRLDFQNYVTIWR